MYGATPSDWTHLDLVLGLGQDLLPVVSNPNAIISPLSHMKDLGKTPSRYNQQHHVAGIAKWTSHCASNQELTRWSKEPDYGICIQTRSVRAIDVDVNAAAEAERIREFIAVWLGRHLPRRFRHNASKFLLAFTLEGEFTKRKFKTANGIVEFLANGQQFVACGTHPSGARYEWQGGLPDEFPSLTTKQFVDLWEALEKEFAIEASTTQAVSVKHTKLADVIANDPVAQFLMNTNHVKRTESDGRMHIICPWVDDHTSETGDSSTTYWPAHTGGYINGHFHCLHAHCEGRTDQEFLDAIEFTYADEFEAIHDSTDDHNGDDVVYGLDAIHDSTDDHDGSTQEKPQRFKVQAANHFAQGKPPQWIIKGVLPRAELAVLFGESGSGKSFAALDMAVDIAQGKSWRGKTTRKGRVVYIAAEGAGGFRKRLQAIAFQRGIDLADLNIGVIADCPNLMEKADAVSVAKAIRASGGADVVVVDTFAQTMPGANENAGEDVGKALTHCKGIHRATGALVMLVHHSGKDSSKGARGWSGLRAAADVELEVKRNGDARSIKVTKQKDGEDGAEFVFKLQTVGLGFDEDDEEITSCVVEHDYETASCTKDRGPGGKQQKLVYTWIKDFAGEKTNPVDLHVIEKKFFEETPKTVDSLNRDRRRERLKRVIQSLIDGGFISDSQGIIQILKWV